MILPLAMLPLPSSSTLISPNTTEGVDNSLCCWSAALVHLWWLVAET